jgi:signal transduction histidine kinase
VALGRRLEIEDLGEKAGTYEASLADALNAEVVPDASGKRVASAELALIGVPSQALLEDAWVTARTRFLWLLAGVMAVVATGLVILTRGLRREIALARRKEDFLAAVTHELKTPLTGIRMHAEMLRQGWVSDPEASERYADRILSETDRLGHLVDQVLDLAALERGVARAQVAPGDLATVVQDAVQTLASRAVEKGAEIRVQVQDGLPQISFDARLVKPLVLNLIDNALKYGVGGEATSIDVTLRKDTGAVLLEVRDQGPGFDAKVLKRPFEPFHRAGNELTRQAPGVGIGLALVRRYAEAHDARVTVDSEPGAGATVSVRFPV